MLPYRRTYSFENVVGVLRKKNKEDKASRLMEMFRSVY